MSLKLPLGNFKWIEEISGFNEDFIKSYNDDNDEEFFLEIDVQYPLSLHNLCNGLNFSPERMKIKKFQKPVANLHDKTEYVMHINNSKQALNHGLVLKNSA